jgi:hypothetical protein
MNMNGNIFIALLHSRVPVGGPLLVVAQSYRRAARQRGRRGAGSAFAGHLAAGNLPSTREAMG